ncbi:hypothetical protein CGCTS75_v011216 [Colletotrichum tropicale]|nr:hypothetical protein CGCTS75_v011216 [Colletotrichum tropicale]
MPLEILERILLFSENLNLLRCNSRIGALLSGRGTLINVIISAFHSTWDCWFGVDRHTIKTVLKRGATDESRSFRRYEKFPELFPGDPEFQAPSSWINVDLIFEARQVWAWRFARDRWYSHTHVGPKDEESDHNTTISSPHDRSGGFGHFDSRDCFEYDWALYGLSGAKPTLDFYVDTLRMGLQNAVTHRNPGNLNGRLIQMLLLLDDFFPSRGLAESQSLWPLDVLEEEHAKVEKLVSARERSTAGPLYELIELERRMFDYHRREVDLLTSRLSRYDRMGPQSMIAVGLVPQPRNH